MAAETFEKALEALLTVHQLHERRMLDALRRIEDKVDGMDRRLKVLAMDTLAEDTKIERQIGKLAADLLKIEDEIEHIDHEVADVDHETHTIEKVAQAMADQIAQGAVANCPKCGSHVTYRAAGDHAYLGVCNACGWHVLLPKTAVAEPPQTDPSADGEKPIPVKGDGEAPPLTPGPHDWVHAGDED